MYLVFDIGGTNMRVAVSTDGKTINNSKIVPTPPDFDLGIQTLKKVAEELSLGEKIQGAAGGVAGPMDKDLTMMIQSPQIAGWINKPLKAQMERAFECKVLVYNDTVVGGLGEATKGAGARGKVVAYLALGSGVGGKRIVDQKIDESSLNFEPGHQIIVPDGDPCNCGGKGHLESYVGGANIEKIYGQRAENIQDPKIWDEIARYLGIGLNNTIVHWSPDIVVLGGSVMKSLPLDRVKAHLEQELKIFPKVPEIVLGVLGHDAGFYGALSLLK